MLHLNVVFKYLSGLEIFDMLLYYSVSLRFFHFITSMFFLSPAFISNMSIHRQYFPDEEDETGAAKALMRLQDTYQLDSEAFSKGKLPGDPDVHISFWKAWMF